MRLALMLLLVGGCHQASPQTSCARPADYLTNPPQRLSSYCVLENDHGVVVPDKDVIGYDLNAPLFSDYALKTRLIWMPPGQAAQYGSDDAFDLPVGSIVANTFAFAPDLRALDENVRLVETRIFLRTKSHWVGLSYVWNDAQSDAIRSPDGQIQSIDFIDPDGVPRTAHDLVASERDCHTCHDGGSDGLPHLLGVSARQLNRDHDYAEGSENQLARWARTGLLAGAPDPQSAPRLADWTNPASGTVEARARAYLDGNCSHCHDDDDLAQKTNLFLRADEADPMHVGLCKPTGAKALASGGLQYDVVPGDADHSVIAYRLAATDPQVVMPLLGRSVVHTQGLALVRAWIDALPPGPCSPTPANPDGAADGGAPADGGWRPGPPAGGR